MPRVRGPLNATISGKTHQVSLAHNGMGAIWWGTRGTCPPHFFRRGGLNMSCPPTFFLLRFCIWRGFKNKTDVCHVLCEELFKLDGRPYIDKLMLKQSLVWQWC